MKLTLGFSPCPNDTYIFDALVNQKIDTGSYRFDVVLEDVETLNTWALQQKLDVSKVSYGVWPKIQPFYDVLKSGGAMGTGVGPLLVSTKMPTNWEEDMQHYTIALPGEHTTAHRLFSWTFPNFQRKQFMRFDLIEDWLLEAPENEPRAGVIIHENRFTYHERGLHAWADLGERWERATNLPIPLGGIVAHKRIAVEHQLAIDELIRASLAYAHSNYPAISDYVAQHAQAMEQDVMRKHINLYVNEYSVDMGKAGEAAIQELFRNA